MASRNGNDSDSQRVVNEASADSHGASRDHLGFRSAGDDLDLAELWEIVRNGKWHIIGMTLLFAVAAVTYSFLATKWYRAETLLALAENDSIQGVGGQLGGLAALAGVSIGASDSVNSVAVLRSRELALEFIRENELLPILYSHIWDPSRGKWTVEDPAQHPDERDAVRYFHQNILSVSEDRNSSLVTLSIEWTNPVLAAEWAKKFLDMANTRLQDRALRDAERNVNYLQQQLGNTNVLTLQQAIGRVLENELHKLMLARGETEFAFRVIDPAYAPRNPFRPNQGLITLIGVFAGTMFGAVWAVWVHLVRPRAMRQKKVVDSPSNTEIS